MKLFLHALLAATLSLSLLSGCAYISGLKNNDEPAPPSMGEQESPKQPVINNKSASTGAAKILSPITHYGN